MVDVDYGQVRIKLAEFMEEQNISINKLAFRAEMQRTQLKAYMKEDVQRVDLAVLSRLCYALECRLEDLIEYVPPQPQQD
jgi:putative transcriptional regulator